MATIEIKNINKSFGKGTSKIDVLKDINFTAQKGELILVLGPSGSGKSTFLTIAGGIQSPSNGEVIIEGQQLNELSAKQRDALRLNKIGFVLQAYSLIPYLTVRDQFQLVDRIKSDNNLDTNALSELLNQLGIKDLQSKYPNELSGGQAQRVAIARALYANPDIVLADEPTAALDSNRVKVVGSLLHNLAKSQDKAIIVVTHDLRLREFADHIYEIMDGKMRKE